MRREIFLIIGGKGSVCVCVCVCVWCDIDLPAIVLFYGGCFFQNRRDGVFSKKFSDKKECSTSLKNTGDKIM